MPALSESSRRRLAKAARIAGVLLAVAAVVFVANEAREQWPVVSDTLRTAKPGWLVAAGIAFVLVEVAYAALWPLTVRAAGTPLPTVRGASLFLVTQTAKFVPGSIWHAVGRVGAAANDGVAPKTTGATLIFEHAASLGAAFVVAGLTGAASVGLHDGHAAAWQTALETVGLVAAGGAAAGAGWYVARRMGTRLAGRDALRLSLGHLAVWTAYGVAASLLAVAIGEAPLPAIGAFTLSWACGLLVIGAPAGLGVREAVMTAVLEPSYGKAAALSMALGSRAIWTLAQLAAAGVALPVLARSRRAPLRSGEPLGSAAP